MARSSSALFFLVTLALAATPALAGGRGGDDGTCKAPISLSPLTGTTATVIPGKARPTFSLRGTLTDIEPDNGFGTQPVGTQLTLVETLFDPQYSLVTPVGYAYLSGTVIAKPANDVSIVNEQVTYVLTTAIKRGRKTYGPGTLVTLTTATTTNTNTDIISQPVVGAQGSGLCGSAGSGVVVFNANEVDNVSFYL